MKIAVLIALGLGLSAPGGALAAKAKAKAPSQTQKLAGAWALSGDSRGKSGCVLTLSSKAAAGGWDIDVPTACVRAFPRLKDAATWTPIDEGQAIGVIDGQKRRLYKFIKDDAGTYVTAPNKDGDAFTLSKSGSAKPGADKTDPDDKLTPRQRMSGDWAVVGAGGKPRCAFTSKSNAAGAEGTLTAKASPGCPAKWKAVGWARWTQKGATLKLLDARGKVTHVLKKDDETTWQGRTKGGDPLYFTRE